MPVFARTKLVIHEDCLAPAPGSPLPGREIITLNYTGPNPQNIYPEIKKLFTTIFKVEEKDVIEREVFWNPDGSFKVAFEVVKDLDKFSFMQFNIDLDGVAKPSREFGKEGSVKIKIEALLRTEYPQDTIWQRSLFYEIFRVFYHKIVYDKIRAKYKEQCAQLAKNFQEALKSFFNVLRTR